MITLVSLLLLQHYYKQAHIQGITISLFLFSPPCTCIVYGVRVDYWYVDLSCTSSFSCWERGTEGEHNRLTE
jgi:hypothetical protein